MSVSRLVFRAARLRCPRCGEGKLFSGWFRMFPACSQCGLKYDREPGYFLGSIYFNYGLTALIVTISYIVGAFVLELPSNALMTGLVVFCVLFPLWFFRYARALWMGFDQKIDPTPR